MIASLRRQPPPVRVRLVDAPVVRRENVALTRVTDQTPAGCGGVIRHFKRVSGKP